MLTNRRKKLAIYGMVFWALLITTIGTAGIALAFAHYLEISLTEKVLFAWAMGGLLGLFSAKDGNKIVKLLSFGLYDKVVDKSEVAS